MPAFRPSRLEGRCVLAFVKLAPSWIRRLRDPHRANKVMVMALVQLGNEG